MMFNKRKKNRSLKTAIVIISLFVCLFLLFCNTNEGPENIVKQDSILLPQITLLSALPDSNKPRVILLSKVPKPKRTSFHPKPYADKQPVALIANKDSTATKMLVEAAKGKGFFTNYTADQGLALDQVYCSYKDKWGNLWFGTNGGGVSKYDGKKFTTYTTAHGLASNVIWCITQDRAGNIWFGTDGSGASKYDGKRFTTYTTAQGLADNVVFSILADTKENLWFGTLRGGVSKYDGKKFLNNTPDTGLSQNAVKDIIEDSRGNIWFATLKNGVSKYDGKTVTSYTKNNGLAGNEVWSIAEDNSGNIWFGTERDGVSKFDGISFTNYRLQGSALNNTILDIEEVNGGILWFATAKSGAISFNGKAFTHYATAQGLPNDAVRTLVEDEKATVWFGTYGGGVSQYAGNSFSNFTTAQGLPNNVVFSIDKGENGGLWFGTGGGGISHYDGNRFTNFTEAEGLASNTIYSLLKDGEGNLWIGTSAKGVSKYDGNSFTTYTTKQGLANNIIFSLLQDRKGNIWIGTSGGGVSKFDGKSFTNYTSLQGLANNVVFCLTEDQAGNIWMGTLGGGVSKFDGNGFTNYTVAHGLANNVIWSITEDAAGNLWFGTQQGLSMLAKERLTSPASVNNAAQKSSGILFETFSTTDGLPDNFITQVLEGEAGILYIGTNLGICELVEASATNDEVKDWKVGQIFNAPHGYPVKDVNAGLRAMFKDSKGIIWIGTGSDKTGLVRFDPAALFQGKKNPPQLFINNIKINNEAFSWRGLHAKVQQQQDDNYAQAELATDEVNIYGHLLGEKERDSIRSKFRKLSFDSVSQWHAIPQNLVLPYDYNNVGFDFTAIETAKNYLVKYQYFLEGFDRGWSPPVEQTFVNFGNISEGNYTFKLKAQSPEGVWTDPISYTFKVLPPWWRTWWMYVFYTFLFVGSIIMLIRWKHRQILHQKKILEDKVGVATRQLREENKKVEAQKKRTEETLSELKATQTQLIQSEKMASLGELTAGIAHEIQNPLNFVNNFSEVSTELLDEMREELAIGNMQRANEIADDVKHNLEKILHHGKQADGIVKGMLQHSRSRSATKEPTDVNKLADEYLRLAYNGLRAKDKSFNATLQTAYDETIGNVNIIPQDMGRVLLNLFNNAFYAVIEKKKQNGDSYEPMVSVSTKKTNGKVEIKVRDNGNGIPSKVLDKIFQPFFTTKPTGQGTGLGLSLSYDIVKAHGGELKVETKEGEFTEFVVTLKNSEHL